MRSLSLRARFYRNCILSTIGCAGLSPHLVGVYAQESSTQLEEVVVTARFRDESAQDVGVAMQAVTGSDLEKASVSQFEDIVRLTPGMENLSRGPGKNLPSIRGTASQSTNLDLIAQPLLNTMSFDDVSLKLIRSSGPEVPLFDLDRVVVLKGPQPTYFGEGAVGGSIRFTSRNPDLIETQGRIRVEGSQTEGSSDGNYAIDGSASVPIINNTMGLRVTLFDESRAGFIDNIANGKDDVNTFDNRGGTGVFLYQPTDDFSWRLSGFYAEQKYGFEQSVTDDVDDLESRIPLPYSRDDSSTLISNKFTWILGDITLESVTGYYDRTYEKDAFDPRASFRTLPLLGILDGDVIANTKLTDENLSQELRILTSFDGWINFVGGLLYVDSDSRTQTVDVTDSLVHLALTGTDIFLTADVPYDGEQKSIYGEFQFSFLDDRLRMAAGARYFDQEYKTKLTPPIGEIPIIGPSVGRDTLIFDAETLGADEVGGSVDVFLPRLQIEYDVGDSALVYASASKGARSGLYNAPSTLFLLGITANDPGFDDLFLYQDDTVWSYELGAKSEWLDGTARVNLAAYYSKWDDMQVSTIVGSFPLIQNLGDSEITGLEWELYWSVNEYFSVFSNGSFQEAEFVDAIPLLSEGGEPLVFAPSGTRIPQTADLNFTAGFEGLYPNVVFGADIVGNVTYAYLGDRLNILEIGKLDEEVPDIAVVDARLGLEQEDWSLFLYAKNLFNEIEASYIEDLGSFGSQEFINTPRTIGLTYRHNF
ncbi:MAG: TonB-dependent receptor [Pseudomonadota bacterium]